MTDIKVELELLVIDSPAGAPRYEGDLARLLQEALGAEVGRHHQQIADALAVAISNAAEMAAK